MILLHIFIHLFIILFFKKFPLGSGHECTNLYSLFYWSVVSFGGIQHAKGFAKSIQRNFENSTKNFYNPKDYVVLKALEFTVDNKKIYSSFGEEDSNKKKQKLQSIVRVQDVENVSHDAYCHFAALESNLPWEYAVSQTR